VACEWVGLSTPLRGSGAAISRAIERESLNQITDSLSTRQLRRFPRVQYRTGLPSAFRIPYERSTVLRAHGGREAIEIAQRELPDLIVLDLMMPVVNGFDVVEALQFDPDTAHIPIMVVTATRITAQDRAKLSSYVTTIVEKTEFDGGRLTAEVRRAMSGRCVIAWQQF